MRVITASCRTDLFIFLAADSVYFYKWLAFNELLIYLHINISERWNGELVGLIGK